MTIGWSAALVVGLLLVLWAARSLPAGTSLWPVPIVARTDAGPYRYLRHPMYVGNLLLIVGLAGLAAGIWNALAVGTVAELLMREWAARETAGLK
jgi:protein-S-isoprenylcysteine O-methyltransferase Ste14